MPPPFEFPFYVSVMNMHIQYIQLYSLHCTYEAGMFMIHMTGYAGSRDYTGNLQSPWRTPHRSTHPTERQDNDHLFATRGSNLQLEGRSLQRQGGVLLGSGMCGWVWGPPWRLQVPYVIPRPGVRRHIQRQN